MTPQSDSGVASVTLNGTLDRVIAIPGFRAGEIWSSGRVLTLGSGKGLNAARAAASLGARVLGVALVAGRCGEWIADRLHQEGLPAHLIRLPGGESRISTIVVDTTARQTTVILDLGPSASPEMWPDFRAQIVEAVVGYPWVILAGASLPGLPDTVYADLCADLLGRGQRVCLDARDQWLASALAVHPTLVKCNQHEAARLLGRPVDTPEQALDAARTWIARGIAQVVITLGRDGAVAASSERYKEGRGWHLTAPEVEALYPIGSGDAMSAGLVVALSRGEPLVEAVRYGVAVGTANTLLPGSGRCALDQVPALVERVSVRSL